ncbi:MAG TPA: hypothetical protein VIN05_03935 [Roseovarius sp.]
MLLVLCLVWYGPLAMAGTGSANGLMTMEICVNGAAQTVQVDMGGAPVEPAGNCCDCIGCSLISGGEPQLTDAQRVLHAFDMTLDFNLSGTSLARISNIRPLPRAPPLARTAILTTQDVIESDHSDPGQYMHSNGRPLPKDADA